MLVMEIVCVATIPCYRIRMRCINKAIDTCNAKYFTIFKLKNIAFPIHILLLYFEISRN